MKITRVAESEHVTTESTFPPRKHTQTCALHKRHVPLDDSVGDEINSREHGQTQPSLIHETKVQERKPERTRLTIGPGSRCCDLIGR